MSNTSDLPFNNIEALDRFTDKDLGELFTGIKLAAHDYIEAHDIGAFPLPVICKTLPIIAMGYAGLAKEAVDIATTTSGLSVDEAFPGAVDMLAAGRINAFLQRDVEANKIGGSDGLTRDTQFRVGESLFEGPHHDQMNLMLNVANRIENPAMREGIFEDLHDLVRE